MNTSKIRMPPCHQLESLLDRKSSKGMDGPEVEKNLFASSSERTAAGVEGGGIDEEHKIKFLQGLREEL